MRLTFNCNEARRLRLHAQSLGASRGSEVVATATATAAVQAQDRLGELLGVGTRSTGLTAENVDHARTVDRAVTRTWLMRGTLHLVPSDDLRWMLDLLGEEMDRKALKRRADLGISFEDHGRVLEFLRPELSRRGPMTRAEIGEALRSAGLPWEGQATPHLLRSASMLGVMCFGPDRNGEATHILIDDWLPDDGNRPLDPGAELARRYFTAYGPATQADFRWWSGLPAADARRAVQAIVEELVEVSVEGKSMWMTSDAAELIEEVLAQAPDQLRVGRSVRSLPAGLRQARTRRSRRAAQTSQRRWRHDPLLRPDRRPVGGHMGSEAARTRLIGDRQRLRGALGRRARASGKRVCRARTVPGNRDQVVDSA